MSDLREAFADLASRPTPPTSQELSALQQRVYALVDELREVGTPPERIVVVTKALARQGRLGARGDAVMGRVVDWCIERYYRQDPTLTADVSVTWRATKAHTPLSHR